MEAINNLATALRKLPGIGSKSARRISFFLAKQDEEYLNQVGSMIANLRKDLKICSECGNISEKDPCTVCSDPLRERKILCVVEDFEALAAFEEAGIYNGVYHVLGTRTPPDESNDLNDDEVKFFVEHVKSLKAEEVIMAMSTKIESDVNYYTLIEALKDKSLGVKKVTRLAAGLPVGSAVEFADKITLHTALSLRTQVPL